MAVLTTSILTSASVTRKYPEALGGNFSCTMSSSAHTSSPGASGWGRCQPETKLEFRGKQRSH